MTKLVDPQAVKPIKWHGGKSVLAKKIVDLMPEHVHYVEPYFGAGWVLFAKDPEGHSEVVNDKYEHLSNFWQTLQSPSDFSRLQYKLNMTPFSEEEWAAADLMAVREYADPVEAAVSFFVRYRQSRQSLGKSFATISRTRTRRGMNEQASSWLSAIECLPEFHQRLQRVVVLNSDALDVIQQQDGPKTHFYIDPPYLKSTRQAKNTYALECSDQHHADLLDLLANLEGTFQLSGYHSELYDHAASKNGWNLEEFQVSLSSSSKSQKDLRVECVWMNYDPPRFRRDH